LSLIRCTKEWKMKNNSYKKSQKWIIVTIITLLFLFLVNELPVRADVGNVFLDFSWGGDYSTGHKRANLANDFRIFLRINEDIRTHDWVKVWFPIDEASCDPADICGEEFIIKGHDESPRFVPNEKYFEKYSENYDEMKVGKLYDLTGYDRVDTVFFEPSICQEPEGNCRMVEDPSGLGYWMMGTVMPSLPKDETERKNKSIDIVDSTSIGYNPCCLNGYPTIIQSCNERSFKYYSTLYVEAWRQGYNPMDWNFSQRTGIIFPATPGRYRVSIATGPEPTPVESEGFVLPCSSVSTPRFTRYKHEEKPSGDYTVKFNVGEGGALDKERSEIILMFPECVNVRARSTYSHFVINGEKLTKKPLVIKNTITLITSVDIDNLGAVEIIFPDDWITNKCSEPFAISVMTSSEPEFVESKPLEETIASGVWIGDVELTNNNAYAVSGYSFKIKFPKDCQLESGDEVCIELPKNTIVPETIDTQDITIQGKFVTDAYINSDGMMCFLLPFKPYIGTIYSIKLNERMGMQNTYISGDYKLRVYTKCSEIAAISEDFEINHVPLKSTLHFVSPDEPDGCNGWYKTPPTMTITCNNPAAKIYTWYNTDEKALILYTGEKKLAPGSQRPIINYFAIYGDEQEEPNSKQLSIDTVPPSIVIQTPEKKQVLTNQLSYAVKGVRDFVEMLTDGKPSHQVADGVAFCLNNGQYTTIIEPEIFPVTERDKIAAEWERTIEPLKEGENILRIRMFDQACNEKIEYYTIICDTAPPEFEIIKPKSFDGIESMSSFELEIMTETGATVEIDGEPVTIDIDDLGNGKSRFKTTINIENSRKQIEIRVTDKAGNFSTEIIEIVPKRKPITIMLKIDSKELKADEGTIAMDVAPTLSSPPLPKELAGNTYVPLRAVLEVLGAKIEWVSETKHIMISMPDESKNIVLQVNSSRAYINTKTVDILSGDGKTKLYPAIVNNRTLIPLRFVAEALGASVTWNAQDKSITIIY